MEMAILLWHQISHKKCGNLEQEQGKNTCLVLEWAGALEFVCVALFFDLMDLEQTENKPDPLIAMRLPASFLINQTTVHMNFKRNSAHFSVWRTINYLTTSKLSCFAVD